MMSFKITGLKETINNLQNSSRMITRTKTSSQNDAANFGLAIAKSKVPVETGETKESIIVMGTSKEMFIISKAPLSDLKGHQHPKYGWDDGKNLNIALEMGDLNTLDWGRRTEPKTGEFHFMANSVEPTKQEFIRLLNVGIQEATK